jgi:hypothetical protein
MIKTAAQNLIERNASFTNGCDGLVLGCERLHPDCLRESAHRQAQETTANDSECVP